MYSSECFYCTGKYSSAFGGLGSQYAYYHEEDENSFQLVDTAKVQKPVYQRGRRVYQQVWHENIETGFQNKSWSRVVL